MIGSLSGRMRRMDEISKVRIEAPLEVQKSWLWLFELMHDKGIITIVKKPTHIRPSRKRGVLPAYFEIKLNREPEA